MATNDRQAYIVGGEVVLPKLSIAAARELIGVLELFGVYLEIRGVHSHAGHLETQNHLPLPNNEVVREFAQRHEEALRYLAALASGNAAEGP